MNTRVNTSAVLAAWGLLGLPAMASSPPPAQSSADAWRQCAATADGAQRLACFDQWAGQQAWQAPAASAQALPDAIPAAPASPIASVPAPVATEPSPTEPVVRGCNNAQYSVLTRFWELTDATDCGTFVLRGYRPVSVSVATSDDVNRQPASPSPDHQARRATPYRHTEARLNLSVRTKIAKGLLTQTSERKDSLWFGYTQQSYWQVFSPDISRPFRTTDHEPELLYIHPLSMALPGGWNLAYGGVGLVHQSNGQSLPLSRSWNRWYLMAGLEKDRDWIITGRVWKRVSEKLANDDNPGISNYIGRAELSAAWTVDQQHTLMATLRSSLGTTPRGSVRLEWLRTLGDGLAGARSNLRLHTQLFSGYGDSLIDYNYRRTVFSVGLSLLDF